MRRISEKKVSFVFMITVILFLTYAFLDIIISINFNINIGTSIHNIFSLLFGSILLTIPSFIYIFKYKIPLIDELRIKKINLRNLLLSLVVLILCHPMISLINVMSIKLGSKNYVEAGLSSMSEINVLVMLFVVAIVPGILEELVFRGVMYQGFKQGGYFYAIVISSLFFASVHMNTNQFSYAIFMGILLATIVEITGSIWTTIILHITFNSYSVLMLYFFEDKIKTSNPSIISWGEIGVAFIVYAVLLFLGIMLIRFIAKINGKQEVIKNYFKINKPMYCFNKFSIISIIITFIVMFFGR